MSPVGPSKTGIDVVHKFLQGEAQRVVLLENDNSVEALKLGHVAGGYTVFPFHPAKKILWCIGKRRAKRVAPARTIEVGFDLVWPVSVERTTGPHRIENRAFQGYQIGESQHLLLAHCIQGTDLLLKPIL